MSSKVTGLDSSIRLATNEDAEEVLSLMRACFGEREFLNKKWYSWFNFDCPTGHNRNYVAIDNATGRFAGSYGLLPIKIKVNDQVMDGSLCTNVMTHPEYQGKGIFTLMGKNCCANEEKYQSRFSLGVPNKKAQPGHMKVGWYHLSDLTFIAKFSFRNEPFKSKEVQKFDEKIDGLISEVSGSVNFMVMKDHKFLNWRYLLRPDKKYRLFIFERNGDVDGYMVIKHFDDPSGYKKTHILDILVRTKEAFDDLILAAEHCSIGRNELNCWRIDHNVFEKYFADNGFVEKEDKDVLIAHTNYGERIEPKPINWWFALGDNDVY